MKPLLSVLASFLLGLALGLRLGRRRWVACNPTVVRDTIPMVMHPVGPWWDGEEPTTICNADEDDDYVIGEANVST